MGQSSVNLWKGYRNVNEKGKCRWKCLWEETSSLQQRTILSNWKTWYAPQYNNITRSFGIWTYLLRNVFELTIMTAQNLLKLTLVLVFFRNCGLWKSPECTVRQLTRRLVLTSVSLSINGRSSLKTTSATAMPTPNGLQR